MELKLIPARMEVPYRHPPACLRQCCLHHSIINSLGLTALQQQALSNISMQIARCQAVSQLRPQTVGPHPPSPCTLFRLQAEGLGARRWAVCTEAMAHQAPLLSCSRRALLFAGGTTLPGAFFIQPSRAGGACPYVDHAAPHHVTAQTHTFSFFLSCTEQMPFVVSVSVFVLGIRIYNNLNQPRGVFLFPHPVFQHKPSFKHHQPPLA